MLLLGIALAATAVGLGLVPSAPAGARWLAWATALAFAAGAAAPPRPCWRAEPAASARADLAGDALTARGAALAAAAAAAPRAVDLELAWRFAASGLGGGPLGALATAPPPLPLQPEDLQVRALGLAVHDRPLQLQVEAPPLPAPVQAELRLEQDGAPAFRAPVQLGSGLEVLVEWTPPAAGRHELVLSLELGGHRLVARGALHVAAAPTVLVLEPSGVVAAALRAQGVRVVETAVAPADWGGVAAVVLGQPLAAAAQGALAGAVADGTGLLVLAPGFGGPGEPLRDLLPVRPQPEPAGGTGGGATAGAGGEAQPPAAEPPPEPPPPSPPRGRSEDPGRVGAEPVEVDKRAIAMVLVVDRSGSMGARLADGRTKMSYAKTSALRTAQALGPGDAVGVVTFGNKDAGRVELALTDATDGAAVRAGIERLAHASEFTFLLGGLRAAGELLQRSQAAVKHVVVVSDGEFDAGEALALRALAHRLRTNDGITLSIISIIDSATDIQFEGMCEELSRDGGGQFVPVRDPGSVPVLVSAEVARSLARVGRTPRNADVAPGGPTPASPERAEEPPPPPPAQPPLAPPRPAPRAPARVPVRAVADSPLLAPLPAAWPSLGAAVPGTAPLDAQVLLVAGDAGWPLLAFGNRGLGRVGAFAADLGGPDGAEFRADDAFPARLSQWLQSVLPAQPAAAPAPLLQTVVVAPPAATPRDLQQLAALAGSAPAAATDEAAAPLLRRELRSPAAAWAAALVGALLALASLERLLAARALRRSA